MKTIGITGGIGSGKSFVCNILNHLGYPIYDSDSRAKALYDEDPILRQELVSRWGEELYDSTTGKLIRPHLAQIIFSDKQALAEINALVHPRVRADFAQWKVRQELLAHKVIFIESALIVGSPLRGMIDALWVVVAEDSTRLQRAMNRDIVDRDAILARMKHQIAQSELVALADHTINNDIDTPLLPQIIKGIDLISNEG